MPPQAAASFGAGRVRYRLGDDQVVGIHRDARKSTDQAGAGDKSESVEHENLVACRALGGRPHPACSSRKAASITRTTFGSSSPRWASVNDATLWTMGRPRGK